VPALTPAVKGVILSGSPFSVRDPAAPNPDLSIFRKKVPLLGICYGAQLLAKQNGGEVQPSKHREYGRANLDHVDYEDRLFDGISQHSQVWMSHADTIINVPENFKLKAGTADVKVAGFKVEDELTWGIQFHPEVYHSTEGPVILRNFIVHICGCKQDWTPGSFIHDTVEELKKKIGNDKVVMGLSGGVDSSVAALLLHKAIDKNLFCIFVDNGLLRKDEFSLVLESYKHMGLNVKGVNAGKRFYSALKGETDPEKKRKIIGGLFIEVFDEEAHTISDVKWLGQGTIYPDVIESISAGGPSVTIKSHHNVGGLPETMKLKVVEPLRLLFKDEVRRVGHAMGLEPAILNRHPFPGPGLGIRILSDITEEKVRILQEADSIFIEGLKKHDLYNSVWQAAVILLPVQSVGVMGDERTYENAVALRAVASTDGMTADWCHLPYEFLGKISSEIINKVKGINRVVYDISSKPPATIEWE
ncbi:MAG TPA: glutamine-hydrolyzing GMP synthase, partial [Bacteroidia bacterium]|nr:glutamine-hydrolyzing GMP synthase [Bacteroidia bacterium]